MADAKHLRLGVNIDHVATIRNARGGGDPDPVRAAKLAAGAGADGITAHLREDRRHIIDRDIERLVKEIDLPLNLEMAATAEMRDIALKARPHACCIVPEHRRELTTEGGLDAAGNLETLKPLVGALTDAGIRVSLFIDPEPEQLNAAKELGAAVVELHTGTYAEASHDIDALDKVAAELARLMNAALLGDGMGLEIHAGHGLNFDNVMRVAAIPTLKELNIGHFLIGQAVFTGLSHAIQHMRSLMDHARSVEDAWTPA